jgi:DNA helicase-2/ATP-dependent DNA helicase PcrA
MDVNEILRDHLDPNQYNAATDPAREILCLACAGSGKSRTLAYRIARLIAEGASPESIVAFTFTKKAAESIKLNVAKALTAAGMTPNIIGRINIGTIHSYCQKMLAEIDPRYRQYDVLDDNRLKLYLISRFWNLGLGVVMEERGTRKFQTVDEIVKAWKILNQEMLQIEDVVELDPSLGAVMTGVSIKIDQDEFLDYSLMVRYIVDALRDRNKKALQVIDGLRHLMVDEYQDVNTAEEALISELHAVRPDSTLFVVGDDDQAIYGWRGAEVSNILSFDTRYPGCSKIELSVNYRSTDAIVQAADGFVRNTLGPSRYFKTPSADASRSPRDFRKLWFETRNDEAAWLADRIDTLLGAEYVERNGEVRGLTKADFAILMRSTRQEESDGSPRHSVFTRRLHEQDMEYTLESGGTVFSREEVRVMRDAFGLLQNRMPQRETVRAFFDRRVSSIFPTADFDDFVRVLTEWGRTIHSADRGQRVRIYPQQIYHDLLKAFGIKDGLLGAGTMRDLGLFSTILTDIETVYPSIDGAGRFGEILAFIGSVEKYGYDRSTDDVVKRPDAITISTVHKMKGLEFPVVFVADVERGRFPKRRSAYNGWIPSALIGDAIRRGRYTSNDSEESRLFYTAMTRAERFLYFSGSKFLPGGIQRRQPSSFLSSVIHDEISNDAAGLPEGLRRAEQSQRVDEVVVPTTFSDIRYYLRCPKEYQFRKSFGFSPPINEMFGFGRVVHTGITKIHASFPERAPDPDAAAEIVSRNFHLKHIFPSEEPLTRPGPWERAQYSAMGIARNYVEQYAEDFSQQRVVEQPFEVPIENAIISGSIDLLLKFDPRGEEILDAVVVDFKTMEGGEVPEENRNLCWWELSLQVQLYAMAAREILGENARTGKVHLLKDNRRVDVPVHEEALRAARENVEWAVKRIIEGDFPMRPHGEKCVKCDFAGICPSDAEEFETDTVPPAIFVPMVNGEGTMFVGCFGEFERRTG